MRNIKPNEAEQTLENWVLALKDILKILYIIIPYKRNNNETPTNPNSSAITEKIKSE